MIEKALSISSTSLNRLNSREYLKQLVKDLGTIINADFCFVCEISDSGRLASSIAHYAKDSQLEDFSYDLAGTPCHDVYSNAFCCYPENTQILYPDDQLLVDMDVEGYFGVALQDRNNQPIGILSALFRTPIQEVEDIKQVFQIFNLRASAELERCYQEDRLNKKISELEEQNQKLKVARQIYDFATDGILITDHDNHVIYIN